MRVGDKPLAVLLILLERPGELVPREELRERLWPEALSADFDNSLNAAIKRLRDVLGDRADAPRVVETIPRRGYRLVAAVEEGAAPKPYAPGALPAATLAALTVALALAAFGWLRRAPADVPAPVRLVVLPLESQEEDEALAGGLTEELTATLAGLAPDRLAVVASTSARASREAGGGIDSIRRTLGATHVVEGALRREDARLRVTLRLVAGDSQTTVWAQAYELRQPAGLALQEAVAARVADALRLSVGELRPRLASRRAVSDASLDDYWDARRALRQPLTPMSVAEARAALERAVSRDPDFALGHAALAETYLVILQARPSAEMVEHTERAAREAIRCDETTALGHAALALALLSRWDLEGARSAIDRSLALDAGQAVHQHWAALVHSALGEHERATREAWRAVSLDPLAWTVNADLGWTYYYARRFDAAVAHERATRERWPSAAPLPWLVPLALHLSGRDDEAIGLLRTDLERRGIAGPERRSFERAALDGARGVAAWARDVFERQARRGPANTQMLVRLNAQLGEVERALEWLGIAAERREGWLAYLAVDPALDPLRGEPRFARLLAAVRSGGRAVPAHR